MEQTNWMDELDLSSIGKFCIIRADKAGVFAGEVLKVVGDTCLIKDSRRLWYWEGAASLSQLSQEGVSLPEKCKFPCAIPSHLVFGVIEIIPCTELAEKSIKGVEVWQE